MVPQLGLTATAWARRIDSRRPGSSAIKRVRSPSPMPSQFAISAKLRDMTEGEVVGGTSGVAYGEGVAAAWVDEAMAAESPPPAPAVER